MSDTGARRCGGGLALLYGMVSAGDQPVSDGVEGSLRAIGEIVGRSRNAHSARLCRARQGFAQHGGAFVGVFRSVRGIVSRCFS